MLDRRSPDHDHDRASAWLPLLACTCIASSCASRTAAEREPWVLGAVYDLTGSQAGLDLPSWRGARLAASEAAGDARGRELRLVVEDGRSDPARVARACEELLAAEPATVALLGLSDTDMVRAAAGVSARAGRVFLTSGATSPRLPAEVPELLFLACFGDDAQAAAGAEWAFRELGARRAAVLYDASMEYTRLLQGYFATRFGELGGVLALQRALADAPVDLSSVDMVYLATGPERALPTVQDLRAAGYVGPILSGDGFDTDAWSAAPELADVYFTTHAYVAADSPDPRVRRFHADYLAAFGEAPDAFAALGYDAVGLLLDALRRADGARPDALRRALAATQGFAGLTGSISYRDGQRVPHKPVTLIEVKGGRRCFLRSIEPERIVAP